MLSGLTAQTGQLTYHVPSGETLTVPASFEGDIVANVRNGGRVIFRGADVGEATINSLDGSGAAVFTIVTPGTDIDLLNVNGSGVADRVLIQGDADVASLEFNGQGGNDRVQGLVGSRIGNAQFVGGAGVDRFDTAGAVFGDLTFSGGAGNDLLLARPGALIEGAVLGTLGGGNDLAVFSGASLKSVDLAGQTGDDLVIAREGTTFDGDLILDFGAGDDRVWLLSSDITVTGDMTLFGSAGSDNFRVQGVSVAGDQTIDLGAAGARRESVLFGSDTIGGSSTVSFQGDASILEFAARDIAGAYQILGRGGRAFITLDQGSTVDGGVLVNNLGATRLSALLNVTDGGLEVRTGSAVDRVRVLAGSQIVGGVTGFLGGNSDRFEFVGGLVDVTGDVSLNLGWGGDTFRTDDLFVDGNLLVNSGASSGITDIFDLGRNVVTGASLLSFAERAIVTERDAQIIGGEYAITGLLGSLRYTADSTTTVAGDFRLQNFGLTRVFAPITVGGDARLVTGDRADRLDLTGITTGRGLDVSTDAGADTVLLANSEISLKASVLLGGGNDFLDNLDAFFGDEAFLDGGNNFDEITDPANGFNVNFEIGGGHA